MTPFLFFFSSLHFSFCSDFANLCTHPPKTKVIIFLLEPSGDDVVPEETTPAKSNFESRDSPWMTPCDRQSPREQTPRLNVNKTKKATLEIR